MSKNPIVRLQRMEQYLQAIETELKVLQTEGKNRIPYLAHVNIRYVALLRLGFNDLAEAIAEGK